MVGTGFDFLMTRASSSSVPLEFVHCVIHMYVLSLSLGGGGGGGVKHLHCNGDYNEEWIYAMIILPR